MNRATDARPHPVRPRDAASLVLVRDASEGPEVLMGRRHSRHAFIPDAFVFPGGKLDAADRQVLCPNGPDLAPGMDPLTRALAAAAIRETFEETGLVVGCPGDPGTAEGTWGEFRARGLAPDLAGLSLMARAITPPESPIRFHARFFLADGRKASGNIEGSGELLDLDWYPVARALALPVIDVTEFVLGEIRARSGQTRRHGPVAFWRYRLGKPVLSYEDAGR